MICPSYCHHIQKSLDELVGRYSISALRWRRDVATWLTISSNGTLDDIYDDLHCISHLDAHIGTTHEETLKAMECCGSRLYSLQHLEQAGGLYFDYVRRASNIQDHRRRHWHLSQSFLSLGEVQYHLGKNGAATSSLEGALHAYREDVRLFGTESLIDDVVLTIYHRLECLAVNRGDQNEGGRWHALQHQERDRLKVQHEVEGAALTLQLEDAMWASLMTKVDFRQA